MSKKRMKVRPSGLRDASAEGGKNTGRAIKGSGGGDFQEWLRTPTGLGIAIAALIVIVGLVYVLTNTASVNSLLGGGPTATPVAPTAAVVANECGPATGKALSDVPAAQRNDYYKSAPPMTIDVNKKYQALICTSKGMLTADLDAQNAPQTVNNFVFLARQGFYDGLTFHRVVNQPDFEIIQGGDPLGSGTGGSGYTVPAEIKLQHTAGALAMARQGDDVNPARASSGSQFYVGIIPLPSLDIGGYTVFGYVTQGLDVAKQIVVGDLITAIDIKEQ
jgi:cyclophilin family peptidyl-prolyl cis-trans isomerase